MTAEQAAIVAAARRCLGARFRLHGRSAATGLDCVGLAAVAHGLERVPAGYALRGGDAEGLIAMIVSLGFVHAATPQPGDLLLMRAGPHQFHCAILTDRGFIHADAGLRRVTEVPGPPRWPVLGCWRAYPKGD